MIIYYTPKVSKTFGVSETTTVKEVGKPYREGYGNN